MIVGSWLPLRLFISLLFLLLVQGSLGPGVFDTANLQGGALDTGILPRLRGGTDYRKLCPDGNQSTTASALQVRGLASVGVHDTSLLLKRLTGLSPAWWLYNRCGNLRRRPGRVEGQFPLSTYLQHGIG